MAFKLPERIPAGPTAPFLLVNSIGRAAADATFSPGELAPWVQKVENHVAEYGKFHKLFVIYIPMNPPPVFWDYKCRKCLWWQDPQGCAVVAGDISPFGWCTLWVPPADYKAFTWPKEFIKGDW